VRLVSALRTHDLVVVDIAVEQSSRTIDGVSTPYYYDNTLYYTGSGRSMGEYAILHLRRQAGCVCAIATIIPAVAEETRAHSWCLEA
jgi:hypothetical protein